MSVSPPPIYLHFLDRELGDAFEFRLELPIAQRALATLTLGTVSPLICSISALLENEGLRGGEGMLADLADAGVLLPHSTHATLTDFLDSRHAMYEHDRPRYPLYYGSPLGGLERIELRRVTGNSTTERMHGKLIGWTEGAATIQPSTSALPGEARSRMLGAVARELARREDRAVTYAMFGAVVGVDPSGHFLERIVRQRISIEYTAIQRGEHGQLASGLRLPLEAIEATLEPGWHFEYDIPILRALLGAAGLGAFLDGWPRPLWDAMFPLRGDAEHHRVVSRIRWIARALNLWVPPHASRDLRRGQVITALRPHIGMLREPSGADARTLLIAAQANLDGLGRRLAEGGMNPQLDATRDALDQLRADVLLVVATEVEQSETLRAFGYPPETPRTHPIGPQIYYELGNIAGRRVFLVRSNMGASGPAGSGFTAVQAISDLRPDWVLMVGIAFGVDPDNQSIGEVVVATEVIPYDHRRVGTHNGRELIEHRDPSDFPDPLLMQRMRVGAEGFGDAKVAFGPVLSGSELVDNLTHRESLVTGPGAGRVIAGEMELHGVAAAARRKAARWGAAKGICDFADGNKGHDKAARQQLAARNAALFVRGLIERQLLDPPG